ncbi:MAG: hypothetical protein P8X82_18385 [Gemmatimonadales bacterium]
MEHQQAAQLGIDMGFCILPIHDGLITTRGDEFVLARLMNDSFREITGHTANSTPESFDLSVRPDDVSSEPHWIMRPDGIVERDAPRMGKAIAYSEIMLGPSLWERLEQEESGRKNKIQRWKEWLLAHGHQ